MKRAAVFDLDVATGLCSLRSSGVPPGKSGLDDLLLEPRALGMCVAVNETHDVRLELAGLVARHVEREDLPRRDPYWRFAEMYLLQQGMGALGELPNDLKWQFGAAIFKRPDLGIGEVAIYASLWVEIPDSDPDATVV